MKAKPKAARSARPPAPARGKASAAAKPKAKRSPAQRVDIEVDKPNRAAREGLAPGWILGRAGKTSDVKRGRGRPPVAERELWRVVKDHGFDAALKAIREDRRRQDRLLIGRLVDDVVKQYGVAVRRGNTDKLSDQLRANGKKHDIRAAYRLMVEGREHWVYLSAIDLVHDLALIRHGLGEWGPKAIEKAYAEWLKQKKKT
ncbi:MAG: hypothetical protein WC830_10125 [Burkholderiales bacterium]